MTVQRAILIGSIIIGMSIVGARVIAPYEFTSGTALVWRLNTITGVVVPCAVPGGVFPGNDCR
jgi:hypothetical protein